MMQKDIQANSSNDNNSFQDFALAAQEDGFNHRQCEKELYTER